MKPKVNRRCFRTAKNIFGLLFITARTEKTEKKRKTAKNKQQQDKQV